MLSTYCRGEAEAARGGTWPEPRGPCALRLWPRPQPFPKSLYTCQSTKEKQGVGRSPDFISMGPDKGQDHTEGRGGEGRAGNLPASRKARGWLLLLGRRVRERGGQRQAWRAGAEGVCCAGAEPG